MFWSRLLAWLTKPTEKSVGNVATASYKHYSQVNALHWYWPNFTPKEIACKGTGELYIDFKAMDSLQKFRYFAKAPVIINSAYRSEKHNKAIGGSPKSQHLLGKAFDIRITKDLDRATIHKAAKAAGFKGIGDYKTFVHIDTRDNPAYWDNRSKK